MKADDSPKVCAGRKTRVLVSELLILSDGRILAHNLTPVLAEILDGLDLRDEALALRVAAEPRHTGLRRGARKSLNRHHERSDRA